MMEGMGYTFAQNSHPKNVDFFIFPALKAYQGSC